MYFLRHFPFLIQILRSLKKDLLKLKFILGMIAITCIGFFEFLLALPAVSAVTSVVTFPIVMFCVGIFVTHLPLYAIVIASLFHPKYSGPLYAICFVMIFLL